jgi:3',5'-cyclic AMP phosphodiesterase CpdA
MIVAQLSDTHIVAPGGSPRAPGGFGPIDSAGFLSRAVDEINRLDPLPDITVVTGDLVDSGQAAEYDHLRCLLAPLRMPVVVIAGNHDSRAALREAFRRDGYLNGHGDDFVQYAVDDYPLRIVAIDTLIPGRHSGELCGDRLDWLDRTLAAKPGQPTLVLMHHPPFVTGIDYMDKFGLANSDGLAAVIARHSHVERILCGHLHRPIDCRFAGTVAGTSPSTAHQIKLNLIPEAPLRFRFEPPGYQLHVWRPDCGLVSHTAVFGDWDGPPRTR